MMHWKQFEIGVQKNLCLAYLQEPFCSTCQSGLNFPSNIARSLFLYGQQRVNESLVISNEGN